MTSVVDVVRPISISPYGQISRWISFSSAWVASDIANAGEKETFVVVGGRDISNSD